MYHDSNYTSTIASANLPDFTPHVIISKTNQPELTLAFTLEHQEKAQWYLDHHDFLTKEQFKDALDYKYYRVNTLYKVLHEGQAIQFKMKPQQEATFFLPRLQHEKI